MYSKSQTSKLARGRHIEIKQSSEITPYTHDFSSALLGSFNKQKKVFSAKSACYSQISTYKIIKLDPNVIPYGKINPNQFSNLNLKCKTNFQKKPQDGDFPNVEFGNDFLPMAPRHRQQLRQSNWTSLNCMDLKKQLVAKRQPT